MEPELLIWTMVAIVGTVGIIKNLVKKDGRIFWTIITLVTGTVVALVALYTPIKVMQVWVAVTGSTLFYDTIFQAFKKFIENLSYMSGPKEKESER